MRSHIKINLLFILLTSLLFGCHPTPQEYRTTLLSFGTLIDITFWGIEQDKAERVINEVEKDLQYMHYAWHAWQPGPISRINMLLETTASFSANPSVLGPISKARQLAVASDHLFNPAISQLIRLWGFHSDDLPAGPPPEANKIKTLLAQNPRMDDITINNVRMQSRNPHVKLDLGGVAKGYGIEQIMSLLKKHGIKNAIVNAGGDLKAIGNTANVPGRWVYVTRAKNRPCWPAWISGMVRASLPPVTMNVITIIRVNVTTTLSTPAAATLPGAHSR